MRSACAAVLVLCSCTRVAPAPPFQIRIAGIAPLEKLTATANNGSIVFVQDFVYDPLVRVGPDGAPTPALASTFKRDSPRSVRVQIRPGATFSDGAPATAQDVVHSLSREGLHAFQDGNWIRIESSRPLSDAELMTLFISKKGPRGDEIGTGPFEVVDESATQLTLRRREPLPHHVGEVILTGYPTARDAFARTLSGEANLLPLPDPNQIEFFNGVQKLKIVHGRALSAYAVAMSLKRFDRAKRRAIVALLPKREIAHLVFQDSCPPYAGDEPSGTAPEQDPSRPLDVVAYRDELSSEKLALAVERALGPEGGNVAVASTSQFVELIRTNDFDLLIRRTLIWPPSAVALAWYSGAPFNQANYSNPRVDAAIDAGDWHRAMQELADDPPIDFICTPERLAVVDARVKNPQLGPYGLLETLPEWEVEP